MINDIINKFGAVPEDIKLKFEGMGYDILKENFEKSTSLEELVDRIKKK